VLAIDAGTTGVTALLVGADGGVLARGDGRHARWRRAAQRAEGWDAEGWDAEG
jgi:hypothetical protein